MRHLIEPEDFTLEEIEALVNLGLDMYDSPQKIGRASCRERV